MSANNRDVDVSCNFSTGYNSVYIYEIDINTIGIKADADGDGVYELSLVGPAEEPTTDPSTTEPTGETLLGDVNEDSVVDISDSTMVQKAAAQIITSFPAAQ